MILAPLIRQRYLTNAGLPLAGGLLYTYAAGTTTPQATYTDYTGGTPNANPVVLDSSGYADVWLDPTLSYKFVLKDSAGNTLWTEDNVSGSAATGIGVWNSNVTYQQGAIVADSSGSGLLYISRTNNNQGNALTSVTNWALFPGGITRSALTTNTTLAVTDHESLIQSDSTAGALTHTLPACSTSPIGLRITVKDIGTGGFTTTVKGSGADTVDGVVTYSPALRNNEAIIVVNTGTKWLVTTLKAKILPTQSIATASSHSGGMSANSTGTYTVPTGVLYIRVQMIGGGAGGLGSGTANRTTNATAGGNSTFGTALLTANGGALGVDQGAGGAGGTTTINSPAIGFGIPGGDGAGAQITSATGENLNGGQGGSGAFGGAGSGGGASSSGGAARSNSGAGGGGAGNGGSLANSAMGPGGGAGGYIDAIIYPAAGATYSYAVGAAGVGANAGTSGNPGGAGASGIIVVTEYYQ